MNPPLLCSNVHVSNANEGADSHYDQTLGVFKNKKKSECGSLSSGVTLGIRRLPVHIPLGAPFSVTLRSNFEYIKDEIKIWHLAKKKLKWPLKKVKDIFVLNFGYVGESDMLCYTDAIQANIRDNTSPT